MNPAMEMDEEAVFNIGTAARKSGLSVTTIRTWEDRYGAVVPTRDHSGRRLYSGHQIAQLTWLRHQIDAGLRASEAHRLLDANDPVLSNEPSVSLGDIDASWATFMAWAESERTWLESMLEDLRAGIGASAAVLGPIIENRLFGSVISVTLGALDGDTAVENLKPLAGLMLTDSSDLAGKLKEHKVASAPGESLGIEIGSVHMAPIRVNRALVGVLVLVANGDDRPAALAEHAARVIESRIEADQARTAFSDLLQ